MTQKYDLGLKQKKDGIIHWMMLHVRVVMMTSRTCFIVVIIVIVVLNITNVVGFVVVARYFNF
jgi:hypothetical protein